jgi:polysaccharide export outer membrane protein
VALRIAEGDEVDVSVFNVPELAVHDQVDEKGQITLPLTGAVRIAGLTSDEAADSIARALSDGGFVNQPQVSVRVKNYGSANIAVLGEVTKPGVYPASDRPRLMQLIQLAGGLSDKAGTTATITHAGLPNAVTNVNLPTDAESVAKANIELQPGDTVVVSRAGMIYVLGEVNQAGAYVMPAGKDLSVLQALIMAKGPGSGASANKSRILRRTPTGLVEIPVKLKEIMQAKAADLTLEPEDVLFVPSGRKTLNSGSLWGTLTSLVVYRVPF